jgi:hypothetical protein
VAFATTAVEAISALASFYCNPYDDAGRDHHPEPGSPTCYECGGRHSYLRCDFKGEKK